MFTDIKRALRRITPLEMASRELAEAELQKLTAQTAYDFSASVVSYNVMRIGRLRAFIASQAVEAKP